MAKTKRATFEWRIRPERVYINGARVEFYREGRRWHGRVIGGSIKRPRPKT
jgi:hypothetical protein